jgi:hypothetical protein
MPLSRAIAKNRSGDIRKVFLSGIVLAGLILLIEDKPAEQEAMRLTQPVRVQILEAIAPPAPKIVFDPDAGLSPRQLMERWEPLINDAARRFKIPAAWIRDVMRSESGGRTFLNGQPITSRAGALGLMQVEPQTYAEMAAQYGLGNDPFEPRDNIFAGAAYLRWLHGKYGFPAMFAAYNDGPGNLEDHLYRGANLPAETRAYVAGITKALGQGADWLSRRAAKVTLTAPNGDKVALDPAKIRSVRSVFPGEYPSGAATVIDLGPAKQAVQESPETVAAVLSPGQSGA